MTRPGTESPEPLISVVVPTYQRRDLVLRLLGSLDEQDLPGAFEVVVIVDGSTDGTAQAIRNGRFGYPLQVIETPNRGLAAARNRGASIARGRIVLFLDDDMEADARLLREHLRGHEAGADAVTGYIPLHPDSPDTLLARGVGRWADRLRRRLASPGHVVAWDEVFGGQLSIRRAVFEELGGFDESFTRGGGYGNEDVDFAYRLVSSGHEVRFRPDAKSLQFYDVAANRDLEQWRQVGAADVALARKHPEVARQIFDRHHDRRRLENALRICVAAAPLVAGGLASLVGRYAARRIDGGRMDGVTRRLYRAARRVEYWRGVHRAGGVPAPRPIRVLCYHALQDLSGDPVLREYGLPLDRFEAQLARLRRSGYHLIGPGEFLRAFQGLCGLPRRPVLLTFDDAYADLARATERLAAKGVSGIVFAVSSAVGATNRWETQQGVRHLPLLSASELRTVAQQGFEIGGHGRTHRMLSGLSNDEIDEEVGGCLEDLGRLGLPRPRFFAYPHGDHDERVRERARSAGLGTAFGVRPGRVRIGSDRYDLPRIEILRRDSGWRFACKVALAGHGFGWRDQLITRAKAVKARVSAQARRPTP